MLPRDMELHVVLPLLGDDVVIIELEKLLFAQYGELNRVA